MAAAPPPPPPRRPRGLSAVAAGVLGAGLDKGAQCSDWEARPLSGAQVAYAALDAHVLVSFATALLPGAAGAGGDAAASGTVDAATGVDGGVAAAAACSVDVATATGTPGWASLHRRGGGADVGAADGPTTVGAAPPLPPAAWPRHAPWRGGGAAVAHAAVAAVAARRRPVRRSTAGRRPRRRHGGRHGGGGLGRPPRRSGSRPPFHVEIRRPLRRRRGVAAVTRRRADRARAVLARPDPRARAPSPARRDAHRCGAVRQAQPDSGGW